MKYTILIYYYNINILMYSVRILTCVIVIVISIIITACICFLKTFIDQSQTLTLCTFYCLFSSARLCLQVINATARDRSWGG